MFKKKLKFLSYNVQDLFVFLDNYNGEDLQSIDEHDWASFNISLTRNKLLEKILGIQKVIQETDPDVILLLEVGGKESLENFNRYFLESKYKVFILPTNSNRGIEIGYLLKNKYEATIKSHRNHKLPRNAKFSRDVPELRVSFRNQLKIIFLGVHLKSKLDKEKKDFEGRSKRSFEISGLKEIFLKLRKDFSKVPIILAGDFNGVIHKEGREPEFQQLFEDTQLEDILELSNIPIEERYTHLFFTASPKPIANQIDYILIEKKYENRLDKKQCYVYRYKNSYGDALKIESFQEKRDLPSDHFPLSMGLKL